MAKLILEIQDKVPLYDNVLVCCGGLHIILAYFAAAVGHIIAESGGAQTLVETSVWPQIH